MSKIRRMLDKCASGYSIEKLARIAEEKRLPFTDRVPNAITTKAINELESGKGKRFDTPDDLFQDLGI